MAEYSNDYNVVKRMFWDGKTDGKTYRLDKDGVKHSLFRALRDYTARTEKKKEGETTASSEKMLAALEKQGFVDVFENYFSSTVLKQTEYDKWHHEQCKKFINIIKSSKIRNDVSYGKSQKIVNMTMKTIYCLDGAEEKAKKGYFDHCHMPLDSFTLEWFRTEVAQNWYNPTKIKACKIKISQEGGSLPKWSKLEFKKGSLSDDFNTYDTDSITREENGKYHYMFFVTMIREYFKSTNNHYKDLTPFQAEFYIWPEIQWEMIAENLYKQDLINKIKVNRGVSTNNSKINKLCGDLMKQITEMLTVYKEER